MTDPHILGALLRRERKTAGLKQAEVAAHIGRDRSTYAGYENGHGLPGRDALVALAKLYSLPLDLLASAEGDPDAGAMARTDNEALVLHCFRRLPAEEAKAYLDLLLARVRKPGN
jgi:transcriptional regulator with XRE-family HTH domain